MVRKSVEHRILEECEQNSDQSAIFSYFTPLEKEGEVMFLKKFLQNSGTYSKSFADFASYVVPNLTEITIGFTTWTMYSLWAPLLVQ